MIIDCHGHYTTAPKALEEYRKRQIEDLKNPAIYPSKAQMKTLEYIEDVGKDTRLYDEIWTAVKSFMSSNEPIPTRPAVKVLSVVSISGVSRSSK